MKVATETLIPVHVPLSPWSRVKILFGWQVAVVFITDSPISNPKAFAARARVGILPPWIGLKSKKPA